MRKLLFTVLLATLAVPAAAQAASAPAALPTLTRTLSAAAAVPQSCLGETSAGRGVAVSKYVAPIAGYVTARLTAASGDWDLVAVDHASGRRLGASQAFGSHELLQTWTTAGQAVDFVGCRRAGGARTAKLSVDLLDLAIPKGTPDTVSVVRVKGAAAQLVKLDALGLDVTESRGAGWADVLVSGAAQRRILQASGLASTTRVTDLDAATAKSRAADARYATKVGVAGSPLPSGRTTYRTPDEIQAEMKDLVAKHPDLVRPVTIGTSFQGRPIQGVEIGDDVKGDDGRPTFFLMGAHHAREWPSAEIALEYALMLVSDRDDPRIAALLKSSRTTVVPVVNVDGFQSTHDASAIDPNDTLGGDPNVELVEAVAPPGGILAYRRKNCDGAIPSGDVPCYLQWGVDNNRNYGNLWGGAGASPDPTSQSYKGTGPRSEPETQAVWNYARTHQVTDLISLHTIAGLVLRPPGLHDGGKAPDEDALKSLGDAMGAATGYASQYSFQLYDTAGTTEDDTYAATGGYGYTIEIGPSDGLFHMAYQTGVVDQWLYGQNQVGSTAGGMREALLLAGEAAASTKDHAIIRGSAPAGAVLRLKKAFDTETSPFCTIGIDPAVNVLGEPVCAKQAAQTIKDTVDTTTTVPASGTFEWHVNQSTRPFVGGGAFTQKLADTPSRQDTFTGGGLAAGETPGVEAPDAIPGTHFTDNAFTITPEDKADAVQIDVSWPVPADDYDIAVYRKGADGKLSAEPVASSGNAPGTPEAITLTGDQAAPGDYVLRVTNYAAVVGGWTATVGRYAMTVTTTTGHAEAYTLTCETGGATSAPREVFIARGQALTVDPCAAGGPDTVVGDSGGTPTTVDPPAGSPGPAPDASGDSGAPAPAASSTPVTGSSVPAAATSRPAAAKKQAAAKKRTSAAKKQAAAKKKAAAKRKAAARKKAAAKKRAAAKRKAAKRKAAAKRT